MYVGKAEEFVIHSDDESETTEIVAEQNLECDSVHEPSETPVNPSTQE